MSAKTVREIIRMLRRFPPDSIVGWADHDHGDDELNALVRYADEATPAQRSKYGVDVVLRP